MSQGNERREYATTVPAIDQTTDDSPFGIFHPLLRRIFTGNRSISYSRFNTTKPRETLAPMAQAYQDVQLLDIADFIIKSPNAGTLMTKVLEALELYSNQKDPKALETIKNTKIFDMLVSAGMKQKLLESLTLSGISTVKADKRTVAEMLNLIAHNITEPEIKSQLNEFITRDNAAEKILPTLSPYQRSVLAELVHLHALRGRIAAEIITNNSKNAARK